MKKSFGFYLTFISIAVLIIGYQFGVEFISYVMEFHNAEDVVIEVSPFDKDVNVYRISPGNGHELLRRDPDTLKWTAKRRYFKKILLSFPAGYNDNLRSVRVRLGSKSFDFKRYEFLRDWIKVQDDTEKYISPSSLTLKKASLPKISSVINWRRDVNPVRNSLMNILPFIIFIVLLLTLIFYKFDFFENLFKIDSEKIKHIFTNSLISARNEYSKSPYIKYLTLGLLFLVISIIFLEKIQPFYFSQADTLIQFFPIILQGCRSFFQEGIFSTFNPYQLCGIPTTSHGTYALTYPITYIAYFISNFLLNNEYFTIEVFAVIHLILGYLVSIWLFRAVGMRPMLAMIASLSFVLCGYNLICGRSFYYMLPVVLWLPLLMLSVIRFQRDEVSWKWILFTGGIIGIFFHAGNAQLWSYALIFFFLYLGIILIMDGINLRKVLYIVSAFSLGLAIAMPLLIPTLLETLDVFRTRGIGNGIFKGIFAMLLPYPLVKSPMPNDWCNKYRELAGHFYYSHSLFTIATFYAMIMIVKGLKFYRKKINFCKKLIYDNLWIIMALVAFLFSLGKFGLLWTIFSHIPPFDKFNYPLKFLIYANLFFILGGGLIIERYLRDRKCSFRKQTVFFTLMLFLLFYHVILCKTAVYTYSDKPYPALPEEIHRLLSSENNKRPQRIYVSATFQSPDVGYLFSLRHNLPTIYKIPSLLGYDPLTLPYPTNDEESLYQYGVKYVLYLNSTTDLADVWTPFPDRTILKLNKISKFKGVVLYQLERTLPLSFLQSNPDISFPIVFTGKGAIVDVSSLPQPSNVVVNLYYRKGMIALADGEQIKIIPDNWNRIVVPNCPSVKKIEIRYVPPWDKGFMVAGAMLLFSISCTLKLTLKKRDKS